MQKVILPDTSSAPQDAMSSNIKELNIGVESISRWRIDDDTHLPEGSQRAPTYIPLNRPLHDVLHRPTLNERLPDLLQPATIDPELTEPSILMEARVDTRTLIALNASQASGIQKATLERALALIDHNELLDEEVRASLATLYRG